MNQTVGRNYLKMIRSEIDYEAALAAYEVQFDNPPTPRLRRWRPV